MNGDLLTTANYHDMVMDHIASGASATIGVFPREVKIDFGVLETEKNGNLSSYKEKPVFKFMVSMGINVFDKSVLSMLNKGEYIDIPDLMMKLKNQGREVKTFHCDCDWLDIGRPDDYERAIDLFGKNRRMYLRDARP